MFTTAQSQKQKNEQFESLLLATVMGTDHHVAVRWAVQSGRLRSVPTDLRPTDRSSSSAGVMFPQVTYKGLPASAYAHHHMALIQHLQRWHQTVQSWRKCWEIKSAYIFWLIYCQDVYEFSIILKAIPPCVHIHTRIHARTHTRQSNIHKLLSSSYERQMISGVALSKSH